MNKVPFTILTGFLGAGKTTVLNRVLETAGGRRIAVLVNELGRISIDTQLILSRGGDVLELAGGCVCCKVDTKNDLWDGIADVIERSRPEHVILETTGIAEPAAIMDGFRFLSAERRGYVDLAGVVTVVEAEAGPRILAEREEAREQVICADRLLLTKLDIASPSSVSALHKALDELNQEAERASFPLDESADMALLAWLLQTRKPKTDRRYLHSHAQGQLVAVSFAEAAPLLEDRLLRLVEEHRPRLYRIKGYVHIAGRRERGYLELAGDRLSLSFDSWPGPPETELVMIGSDLDEAALRRQLWACRAEGAS